MNNIKTISSCLFLIVVLLISCNTNSNSSKEESLVEDAPKIESLDSIDTSNPSSKMLNTFLSPDCYSHLEMDAFECECYFSINGGSKEPAVFVSNFGEKACVSVDGQLNALYPDWEERDYKKELGELSSAKEWITVEGDQINYFGKPLSFYKYENAVEFLTDVILASGKSVDEILMQDDVIKKMETEVLQAISKAKDYQSKGGKDALTILKMDNRTYDVFVRYRQTTQFEGEANHYEGNITLLKHRSDEILETIAIKGTCGC